ncbi:hypothetical protein [Aliivibrio sp. S2MY1]|uniref:hypothetical protein n=1 Tax=Aliivibrio sp. S2MY1 TaxID=3028423 RepID=UPI002379D17D|nr:hypothetical protein [Aliivibrio sp. S2MY1]MDD9200793.1 hypothetical protein [Aliivibrio sp. S2MY1]
MLKPLKKPSTTQKNKLITLRTDDTTRLNAHIAARALYEQTLSDFLSEKIQRLIKEYERELPLLQKAEKKRKLQAEKGEVVEVVEKKRLRGRPRKPQSTEVTHMVDIGMD